MDRTGQYQFRGNMAPKPKPANSLDLQQLKDEIMKEIDLAKQVNSKEVKAADGGWGVLVRPGRIFR